KMGAVRYRDAYGLSVSEGEAWVFDYGAVVSWNLAEADRQRLCHELTGQIEEASNQPLLEDYSYRIDAGGAFNIQHD
ncbi:RMD1 family protein, partial [Klebsiella pneumoniae]|uniref:RMD1 family protein n=1 Tax=Klebsiella pneumoniae TaxID=573 RepID=UPI0013A5454C